MSKPPNNATDRWLPQLPVQQLRIARPTDQIEAVERFYRDGLGLIEIDRFDDHDGYSGVMFGLPGANYHLEFTTHADGSPGAAPSRENLIVLYFGSSAEAAAVAKRLAALGHDPVMAENPYWEQSGGDHRRGSRRVAVVLVPTPV